MSEPNNIDIKEEVQKTEEQELNQETLDNISGGSNEGGSGGGHR
ncbi:MAG TPA: hypothetical protein VKB79_09125 [Bryobacteraceae bacterium]|nr:hypothetical protein [Bryobacteraceae bacterium]